MALPLDHPVLDLLACIIRLQQCTAVGVSSWERLPDCFRFTSEGRRYEIVVYEVGTRKWGPETTPVGCEVEWSIEKTKYAPTRARILAWGPDGSCSVQSPSGHTWTMSKGDRHGTKILAVHKSTAAGE